MGAVEPQALLRALAEQAGVSYLADGRSSSRVHDAPGGLAVDAIQALRLVPIGPPDGGRIRVAFPAPVPRAALTIVPSADRLDARAVPGRRRRLAALLEHYGARRAAAAPDGSRWASRTSATPCEATRRLAQVVMAAGEARMRDARWGPTTCGCGCRAPARGFDLLLDQALDAGRKEEESWQAATTSR